MPRNLKSKNLTQQNLTDTPKEGTVSNKPMHGLPEEELWLDKSIMDDAKSLAELRRYTGQLYMGMKDLLHKLKLLTPEQLAIVDANMWTFKHDMSEFRSALIDIIEELQSMTELDEGEEDKLEQHLVALKAYDQEKISEHIKKREAERRSKLAEQEEASRSTKE